MGFLSGSCRLCWRKGSNKSIFFSIKPPAARSELGGPTLSFSLHSLFPHLLSLPARPFPSTSHSSQQFISSISVWGGGGRPLLLSPLSPLSSSFFLSPSSIIILHFYLSSLLPIALSTSFGFFILKCFHVFSQEWMERKRERESKRGVREWRSFKVAAVGDEGAAGSIKRKERERRPTLSLSLSLSLSPRWINLVASPTGHRRASQGPQIKFEFSRRRRPATDFSLFSPSKS